jgi:hypothetical protein
MIIESQNSILTNSEKIDFYRVNKKSIMIFIISQKSIIIYYITIGGINSIINTLIIILIAIIKSW